MANSEIAKILLEISEYLAMEDIPFKPQAYERASQSVESYGEDAAILYKRGGLKALTEIPGIGRGIALKIEEYLKTGKIKEYEAMKKALPVDVAGLAAVSGVGPKAIKALWEKLKIRNVKDLERAARAGKIARLPRFGRKSEEKILKGLEFVKGSGKRFPLGDILPYARGIEETLKRLPEIENLITAGSIRRWKETVGDIDILATAQKPRKVMEYFTEMAGVKEVLAKGSTKSMVKMRNGIQIDLRVVPEESWGAALNYFTGSKEHNVALRELAVTKGYKLNEYGLYKGARKIAGETEEDLYRALGLSYIEPEMRENTGEISLARARRLPQLIGYGDLRGDLQTQTDWTDGRNSIREMALAAKKKGLEYIVITDHTKTLAMTGGSDEKKLLRQMAEIDKINLDFKKEGIKFTLLKGAEVNILADGSLDIDDKVLARLDCVGAGVHTYFKLSRDDQTKRIIRAMENPHLDILFHLTARRINRREPIELEFEEVVRAAKRTKTILEIDAHPERLDLKDEHIRRARQAGIKFSVDSDAHAASHFDLLEYGIAQARRGWLETADVINTLPCDKMLKTLKDS